MNNKQKSDYVYQEIQIDVGVTSFMMAVSTFFTGFLISSYDSFNNSVRIPVLFLVISTLSFLFTNIVFANASGEIRRGCKKEANKHAIIGTIIAEFLGVYLLVISIPLVINALTEDVFLRVTVFIVTMLAILGYSISTFSIIKRYIVTLQLRLLYSIILILLIATSFLSQEINNNIYIISGVLLILYLIITTFVLLIRESK